MYIDYIFATSHVAQRMHGSGMHVYLVRIRVSHCCTGACTALAHTCMVVVSTPRFMLRFYARICVLGRPS